MAPAQVVWQTTEHTALVAVALGACLVLTALLCHVCQRSGSTSKDTKDTRRDTRRTPRRHPERQRARSPDLSMSRRAMTMRPFIEKKGRSRSSDDRKPRSQDGKDKDKDKFTGSRMNPQQARSPKSEALAKVKDGRPSPNGTGDQIRSKSERNKLDKESNGPETSRSHSAKEKLKQTVFGHVITGVDLNLSPPPDLRYTHELSRPSESVRAQEISKRNPSVVAPSKRDPEPVASSKRNSRKRLPSRSQKCISVPAN